ncbi:MAG: pyridoxamine 5'-phosphate oxidase [Flavobacteriia bacterium]|nr:pyridoxamine 5'-phosphate oxidase [Flavobacteriia bacterium]
MSNSIDALRNDHSDFRKNTGNMAFTDPWTGFRTWFDEAVALGVPEANAVVLSTVSASGAPSSRVVYLKEMHEEGFVFYTNFLSQKGRELRENPNASFLFFWPSLERQVRMEGRVKPVPEEISDRYFASRPRESQLGAWASHQSEPLGTMDEIHQRFQELEAKFPREVPRPPHWGGMALHPNRFEFWQGKPSRLHERLIFEQRQENWISIRLNP